MLIALNKDNQRVVATDATKSNSYHCPECNTELIVKKGNVKIHHFAHYPSVDCEYSGESMRHISIQPLRFSDIIGGKFDPLQCIAEGQLLLKMFGVDENG